MEDSCNGNCPSAMKIDSAKWSKSKRNGYPALVAKFLRNSDYLGATQHLNSMGGFIWNNGKNYVEFHNRPQTIEIVGERNCERFMNYLRKYNKKLFAIIETPPKAEDKTHVHKPVEAISLTPPIVPAKTELLILEGETTIGARLQQATLPFTSWILVGGGNSKIPPAKS